MRKSILSFIILAVAMLSYSQVHAFDYSVGLQPIFQPTSVSNWDTNDPVVVAKETTCLTCSPDVDNSSNLIACSSGLGATKAPLPKQRSYGYTSVAPNLVSSVNVLSLQRGYITPLRS